jgi:crossover junction endodeoxyribonuclease RuvC
MHNKKIILGVDPGFACAGYSVIEQEDNRFRILQIGVLRQQSSLSIKDRLGKFFTFFDQLSTEKKITHLCLETPFLGKNASNFLKLGYLRGILNLISYQNGCELFEFSPREIKSAITGYGNADKDQVAAALSMFFPILKQTVKMPLDATDALAIGLCGGLRS